MPLLLSVLGVLMAPAPSIAAQAPGPTLDNGAVRAIFGPRGLTSLTVLATGRDHAVREDGFGIGLDGAMFRSEELEAPTVEASGERVTYRWRAGPYEVEVAYELRPSWRFLSKRILVTAAPTETFRVDSVRVFDSALGEAPSDVFVPRTRYPGLGTGDYGGALRFTDGSGLLVVAQNPFLRFGDEGAAFTLDYAPDMEWRTEYGPFAADRGLLAPYRLTGRRIPAAMVPEWRWAEPDTSRTVDRAEVETFTELVRSFLLYDPEEPVDVYVAWTANDYQIDIATPEGRAEYARMLDVVSEVGVEHVVFAPTNSNLSRRIESTDGWSWENLLWLGLGQKIRKGEWDPRSDSVPPSVQEMLDYADSRGLRLMAYVYPVLPFSQNPDWLVPLDDDRSFANLGFRSLQDWLLETLVAFRARTGVSGFAFDYTFLDFPGTSRYAQWYGWRRVMEELRRREPDIVMDGRQAYHLYGPWTWLAGSYPHPTLNDEQPESFVNFPDLHFDRVSANRQRFTAWLYRNHEFAPTEIVPGYMTHQTPRNGDEGRMPQVRTDEDIILLSYRRRDWDYLGWRFSVLSSIGTAGWANVVSMLPGRDTAEYRHFSRSDRAWLRHWLNWTEENQEYLRHTRTILGQPAIGKVDGTAAILGDGGYLFLFNPNGRRLTASLALDASIGLEAAPDASFLLRELHPVEGRLKGKPGVGVWTYGDAVSVPLAGGSARVLEIRPAGDSAGPRLFNAPGRVTWSGRELVIEGVRGEVGTIDTLLVEVPRSRDVARVRVNGRRLPHRRANDQVVAVPIRFAGEPFHTLQQVGTYDPDLRGGTVRGRFTVPARVFRQLAERQRAWPMPWTPEDYRSTWLAPQRLLLFVQAAEPDPDWAVRLALDGQPVELERAYSSIRPHGRTFVGFYTDVSLLQPDRSYEVELELPKMEPGQFQGLFFENVETEYTDEVVAPDQSRSR